MSHATHRSRSASASPRSAAARRVHPIPKLTIGLDLGDRESTVYAVDAAGACVDEGTLATRADALTAYFGGFEPCRIVCEVGTHSPWVARLLAALGHEVIVANPGAMYARGRRRRRNDRLDAEFLARQGRADVTLLCPIQHRGPECQEHLALVRARDQVVRTRTTLINHVRGAVKTQGGRLPRSAAESFPKRARPALPAALTPVLGPMLELITTLTTQIRAYDQQLATLAETHYRSEVARLTAPAGVGTLTALAYVLVIEDPTRFARRRDVGAYIGLVPRLDESSDSRPQLRISKAGDPLLRRLLVSAAQYILGPFGPDCDLRRFGEAIAARGGTNAKKRAAVAVARKLAVLLHRLWTSATPYDPNFQQQRSARDAA